MEPTMSQFANREDLLEARVKYFEQQRDELLEVLKIIDERFGKCRDQYIFSKRIALDKVRNVIAKCEA